MSEKYIKIAIKRIKIKKMKFFLLIIAAVLVSHKCNGQQFAYCAHPDDIYTLWPDWEDNTIFVKCGPMPGMYFRYNCPNPLLFSFSHQVRKVH